MKSAWADPEESTDDPDAVRDIRAEAAAMPALSAIESSNIQAWKSKPVTRQDAEATFRKTFVPFTSVLIIVTFDSRAMTDGLYLVRPGREGQGYVLSMVHSGGFQHYKIEKTASGVALLDALNGHREFSSLVDLVKFFKVYDPTNLGGLACQLDQCIPSSLA